MESQQDPAGWRHGGVEDQAPQVGPPRAPDSALAVLGMPADFPLPPSLGGRVCHLCVP